MSALTLSEHDLGLRFAVHVKPRSSRSRLEGVREDGALAVALMAPPVEGAANAELVALLARALGVKKAAVRVVAGASGRRKVIEVSGLDVAATRARLEGA